LKKRCKNPPSKPSGSLKHSAKQYPRISPLAAANPPELEYAIDSQAERLTAEFGKGFGRSNRVYCRSFYLAYQELRPIVQTPSGISASDAKRPSPSVGHTWAK
jgi:hypothetical protein